MADLRNCPLCGADARLTSLDGIVADGHTLRFIACTNETCQASVWKPSDEEAIAAWNKRYPTAWCDCGDSHTNESVCANCLMMETAQPEDMVSVPREVMQQLVEHYDTYHKATRINSGVTADAATEVRMRFTVAAADAAIAARQALERREG